MKIIITKSNDDFDQCAASTLHQLTLKLIQDGRTTPNITLARGSTQDGIYAYIRNCPKILNSLSQARFFQLDEVYPAQKSFAAFSEEEILNAVFNANIPIDRWITFLKNTTPEKAIKNMRAAIHKYGGLDIAFLGIGAQDDDHYAQIGKNVPIDTDIINPQLSEGMIASYAAYVNMHPADLSLCPTHGLSLGPAAMPDHIIVTAKGENKALPVFNMLCKERSPYNAPQISTTFLKDKKHVTIILDEKAAAIIKKSQSSLPAHTEMIEYNTQAV